MTNYIDNKRFEELITQYCNDKEQDCTELMMLFDTLVSNIIDAFHFKCEKEDAKQECFLLILRTLKNFKPENGSAFNYFTTVIMNNLRLITTKIKKHKLKLESYFEHKYGFNPNPVNQYDVSS